MDADAFQLSRDGQITVTMGLGAWLMFAWPETVMSGVTLFVFGAWQLYGAYVEPILVDRGVLERTPDEEMTYEEAVEHDWAERSVKSLQQPFFSKGGDQGERK